MSMREEFEAVARAHQREKLDIDDETLDAVFERTARGGYASLWLQAAWWAWQASRETLEVELPCQQPYGPHPDDWGLPPAETREAIEAAGVRVKP
jgi:hypothetical protein